VDEKAITTRKKSRSQMDYHGEEETTYTNALTELLLICSKCGAIHQTKMDGKEQ